MYETKSHFLESVARRGRKRPETLDQHLAANEVPTFERKLGSATIESLVVSPTKVSEHTNESD